MFFNAKRCASSGLLAVFVVMGVIATQPVATQAQDLEELLQQVGPEYGKSYLMPFINAHGANQNAGIYHTADMAGTGFHLSIGLKVMATQLAESDQTFRRVLEDLPLGEILPDDPYYDQWRDETGDVVMQGPTVFGNSEEYGTMTAYVNGIPIYTLETIPGLVETRFVPLFAPQATLGRIFGVSGTLRYFPEMELSSYGKTKFFGWGVDWGVNTLLPFLPFDAAIGYFKQELDVGSILQTNAESFFLALSADVGILTIYGGAAKEKSDMEVAYEFAGYDELGVDAQTVGFTADGVQETRFTIGGTLNVGLKLNLEASHGKLTTYTAGLIFGN